jgi:hypothetical protein
MRVQDELEGRHGGVPAPEYQGVRMRHQAELHIHARHLASLMPRAALVVGFAHINGQQWVN